MLFAVAEPLVKLLGARKYTDLTEAQLRLTPVIVGSATVLLFGAGVEMFGFIPCLVAALLFAFAPLPVYYSRYFIHETLFVAATLGLILTGWRAWQKNSAWSAALAGLCAGLLLACKETVVIHFFALALAMVCRLRGRKVQSLKVPPLLAIVVCLFVSVMLFTWFGQNWAVFADLQKAVPNFTARAGGEGHEKPFGYYFHLLDPTLVLMIVAVGGGYAAICEAVSRTRKPHLPLAILY